MKITKVEDLNEQSFNLYGDSLELKKNQIKCDNEIVTHWHNLSDLGSLGKDPVIAYVKAYRRDFTVSQLERHVNTSEIFFPVKGLAVMVFTTSNEDGLPDLSNIKSFLLEPGKTFISKRGIWHWVPFPVEKEWESYLLVENDLVENDIEVFDLEDSIKINF